MRRYRSLITFASVLVLLLAVLPPSAAAAADDSATLRLALVPRTSTRYQVRAQVHVQTVQSPGTDDEQVQDERTLLDEVFRYDIGALQPDGSAAVTVVVEHLTTQHNDEDPVEATNPIRVEGRLLPTGGVADLQVIEGAVTDRDRVGIGAYAFEYVTEPLAMGRAVDRPFPVLLLAPGHSVPVSLHSATVLTQLTPAAATVVQDLALHETDAPADGGGRSMAVGAVGHAQHEIDRASGWPTSGAAAARLSVDIQVPGEPDEDGNATDPTLAQTITLEATQAYVRLAAAPAAS